MLTAEFRDPPSPHSFPPDPSIPFSSYFLPLLCCPPATGQQPLHADRRRPPMKSEKDEKLSGAFTAFVKRVSLARRRRR